MSNHKFRLSDMIPNSWFYKLRGKTKTRDSNPSKKIPSSFSTKFSQKTHLSHPTQPYYYSWESPKSKTHKNSQTPPLNFSLSEFDDHFPDLPRISSKRSISRRKTIYKPSPRIHQFCYDETSLDLDFLSRSPQPELESDYSGDSPELFKGIDSISSSCSCGCNSSAADIITDVKETTFSKYMEKFDAFDPNPHHPTKSNHIPHENAAIFSMSPQERENLGSLSIKKVIVESAKTQKGRITNKRAALKYSSPSSGRKLRTNSPRISIKKIQGQQLQQRRSKKDGVFESLAVVKESDDPERDFRESMMEMIVENNIRVSKHLEDLLACYLTLNSNEYHQLIMKAFEQIWFKLPDS